MREDPPDGGLGLSFITAARGTGSSRPRPHVTEHDLKAPGFRGT